jgi:hypothetical protein
LQTSEDTTTVKTLTGRAFQKEKTLKRQKKKKKKKKKKTLIQPYLASNCCSERQRFSIQGIPPAPAGFWEDAQQKHLTTNPTQTAEIFNKQQKLQTKTLTKHSPLTQTQTLDPLQQRKSKRTPCLELRQSCFHPKATKSTEKPHSDCLDLHDK